MGQNPEAVEEWKRLYALWRDANQAARKAQDEIRDLTMGMANGGVESTNNHIWEAEALERHADLLRMEMDGFVLGYLS